MRTCRVVDFLYGAIPVARWRGYLVRVHYDRCPACQSRLAGREEVRRLLVREFEPGEVPDFWPTLERRLDQKRGSWRPAARFWLRGAGVAAAILLAVMAVNLWVLHRAGPPVPAPPAGGEVFSLLSVQVGQKPASAFVYQPKDSPLVLVWVEPYY
jgi:hypothetical protein